MTRSMNLVLASLLTLTILGGSASACNQRCRPVGQASQGQPPITRPQPQQLSPSPNGLAANDEVINDLPVDAKLAIRAAAAKVRTSSSIRQPVRTVR